MIYNANTNHGKNVVAILISDKVEISATKLTDSEGNYVIINGLSP